MQVKYGASFPDEHKYDDIIEWKLRKKREEPDTYQEITINGEERLVVEGENVWRNRWKQLSQYIEGYLESTELEQLSGARVFGKILNKMEELESK